VVVDCDDGSIGGGSTLTGVTVERISEDEALRSFVGSLLSNSDVNIAFVELVGTTISLLIWALD
jgi:hypothetical protein